MPDQPKQMTEAEMTIELAEKVMGWPRVDDQGRSTVVVRGDGTQDFWTGDKWMMRWQPTKEIAHAWSVVEKMRADKWAFQISDPWRDTIRVTFMRDPVEGRGRSVRASGWHQIRPTRHLYRRP